MPDEAVPDWALIEKLYRARELTLAEIARRCGVSDRRIRMRASAQGWPPRRPASAGRAPEKDLTLKERLVRAMETKLRHIEERLEAGPPETPAESERETRELVSVSRHLERLGRVEPARSASAPADVACEDDDAERWRHEIAERLERIRQRLRGR